MTDVGIQIAPESVNFQATRPFRVIATPSPTTQPSPVATATPIPTFTPTPLPQTFVVGQTVAGRDIVAHRYGDGEAMIMLIGGIHGGWEANTVELIQQLMRHFETHPESIVPGVSFLLIPVLNPDGLAAGRDINSRFNGNTVDLNRNWGCGWSAEAFWRDQHVDPGSQPFSEPETQAVAALIRWVQPSVVLFYHSAAKGVFAGHCDGGEVSDEMAAVYGEAAGYEYGGDFTAYPVTGTGPSWVDGLGIPSADVELATKTATEFAQNLRAIIALQCWLVGADDIDICE